MEKEVGMETDSELKVLAAQLKGWREIVKQQTIEALSSEVSLPADTLVQMEAASPSVPVGAWVVVWRKMGVMSSLIEHTYPVNDVLDSVENVLSIGSARSEL